MAVDIPIEILRKIQASMARLEDGQVDIRQRLCSVEASLAFHTGMFGTLSETLARQQVTLDRFDKRLDRIERRLELADNQT